MSTSPWTRIFSDPDELHSTDRCWWCERFVSGPLRLAPYVLLHDQDDTPVTYLVLHDRCFAEICERDGVPADRRHATAPCETRFA